VTDDAQAAYAAGDERLLYLVRGGDIGAFEALWQRHEHAIRRMARCLVAPDGAEDVVAETFGRVLEVARRGRGPADAFRPYLLTALRQVSYERQREQRTRAPAHPGILPGLGEPLLDPAAASLEASMVVRAFRSLPEFWIAVLWHTEIEQTNPAELGLILGATPAEFDMLRSRAWEGLRRAYLREYLAHDGARPECQAVARRLADFVEDALSERDSELVIEHLNYCDECHAVCAELTDIDVAVRTIVAPVFLGSAAGSYLSAEHAAAAEAAAAEMATAPAETRQARLTGAAAGRTGTAGAAVLCAVRARLRHAAWQARHASRPLQWAAGAAVLAIAVLLAVIVTAPGSAPAGKTQQQALAAPPAQHTAEPAHKSAGAPPAPTPSPPPPTAAPSKSPAGPPAAVPLAAELSVTASSGLCFVGNANEIMWTITNTGSAATGELTVSLTLPSGASLQSDNSAQELCDQTATGAGCEATASGATCQFSGISPGGQTQDTVVVLFPNGGADCGLPVELTASSGSVSASAQVPGGINCNDD
jgi:DNA-directed RNA polymerase specialized sigma24 family protein